MLDSNAFNYILFQPMTNNFFNLRSFSRVINIGCFEADTLPPQVRLEPNRIFGRGSTLLGENQRALSLFGG